MAINYSSYAEVPWYRRNSFALLLVFLFSPPLLVILLTGNVYYQRKGELRSYSGLVKGLALAWSAITLVATIGALADKETRAALFDMRPKEDRFMEQMQGVWKTANASYACLWDQPGHRLICQTDELGIMPLFEIQANGKLDTANYSMPVKYVTEILRPEQVVAYAVVAQASAILGKEASVDSQLQEMIRTQAQRIKSKSWDALLRDVDPIPVDFYVSLMESIAPCFRKAIESGAPVGKFGLPDISSVPGPLYTRHNPTTCPELLEYLVAAPPQQVLGAIVPKMATALVTLRNAAKKPDEKFLPELIPDKSEALELSFVRQLNESEIVSMPQAMVVETERRKYFAAIGPEFTAFWEAKLAADLRKVVDKVRIEAAAAASAASTATEQVSPRQAE